MPSCGSCLPTAPVSAATCCVDSSAAPLTVSACASRSVCSRCCAWARSARSAIRMRASCQRSSACTQRSGSLGSAGSSSLRSAEIIFCQAATSSPDAATWPSSRSSVEVKRPAPAPRSSASKASSSWRSQPAGSAVSAPCTARAISRSRSWPCSASRLSTGGLGHGDRTGAAGARQPREATARLPHHQLGRRARPQLDLAPLELRQHQVERRLALLVERLPDGGERRRGEARVLDVVEADHRDVGRNLQPALLERAHRRQRHVVVAGDEPVEGDLSFVDQQLDRRLARALLERPLADERRVDGEAALGQHGAVDGVAALRLGVDRRAANEGDPPAAVAHEEVLERLPHPGLLVERQAGDVGRAPAPGWPAAAAPGARRSPRPPWGRARFPARLPKSRRRRRLCRRTGRTRSCGGAPRCRARRSRRPRTRPGSPRAGARCRPGRPAPCSGSRRAPCR